MRPIAGLLGASRRSGQLIKRDLSRAIGFVPLRARVATLLEERALEASGGRRPLSFYSGQLVRLESDDVGAALVQLHNGWAQIDARSPYAALVSGPVMLNGDLIRDEQTLVERLVAAHTPSVIATSRDARTAGVLFAALVAWAEQRTTAVNNNIWGIVAYGPGPFTCGMRRRGSSDRPYYICTPLRSYSSIEAGMLSAARSAARLFTEVASNTNRVSRADWLAVTSLWKTGTRGGSGTYAPLVTHWRSLHPDWIPER